MKEGRYFCSPGGEANPELVPYMDGGGGSILMGLRRLIKKMSARMKAKMTAAPPMAMPAIAPGDSAGEEEVEVPPKAPEDPAEVDDVGAVVDWEMTVGIKCVGTAEGPTLEAAEGMPEADRLT